MSRQVVIYKAVPIGPQEIEDLVVRAELTPPENVPFHTAQDMYRVQAHALVDALSDTLPGGLMHQILVELLIRKTCLLRVPDHVSQPAAAGFVEAFASWWEDAGHIYYHDDEGLESFYRDACVMLAHEPQEAPPS